MAGEQTEELPEPLREWVEARAAETGRSPPEVLARAAAAYRLLDEHDELFPEPDDELLPESDDNLPDRVAALEDGLDDVRDRIARIDATQQSPDETGVADAELAEVESRVSELETALDEKVQDVRERVIQVKRETDEKAPADHDHPELRADVEAAVDEASAAAETAEAALSETETLAAGLTEVESAVDGGFDNYESILRGLKQSTDDVRDRTDRLVAAVTRLRDRVVELEAAAERRADAETLQQEATQKGVTDAVCGSCESTVYLGLLGDARCPHCEAPFDGVDTETGLFRPARLPVTDRPALESTDTASTGRADPARSTVETDSSTEPADIETLLSDAGEGEG
jgi:DNA repair exonuclease SbcCD ATPase subunit